MTAQRAAAIVAEVIGSIAVTERFITLQEPWAEDMFALAIDAALTDGSSRKIPRSAPPVDPSKVRQIVFSAQDAATRRIWQQHRVVYDLDPDLWGELGAIDEGTILPASVFAHLPHPDPFLVWPVIEAYPLLDGTYMRSVGAFVTSRSQTRIADPDTLSGPETMLGWPVSTHSPHAKSSDLVITIVANVEDAHGNAIRTETMGGIPDCIIARMTLNFSRSSVRVGDLIDDIAARYSNDETANPGASFNSVVRSMLRRIISTLLYLCATNADLRPLPAPAARRAAKGTGRAAKPPRTIAVGYDVGAGLRAWRRSRPADHEPAAVTDRHVRPHVRRAHPHLYWTGEGRKTPRVHWLWPIRINAATPIGKTTVQPVRKRERSTAS